jgi:flagellar M-ring protein FliF
MMHEDFSDDGSVLREQKIREQVTTSMDREDAAGAAEDDDAEERTTGTSMSQTGDENAEREQRYEIDRTVTNTLQAPGRIQRLTASVFIAKQVKSASQEGEAPVAIDRSPEELQQLKVMVANALGIALEDPASGSVVLQETSFNQAQLLANLGEESSFLDPMFLLDYGQEIIGSVIALILLLVFLNQVKRARNEKGLLDRMAEERLEASANVSTEQEAITPQLLNELIQQKPENISSNLKTWLRDKSAE